MTPINSRERVRRAMSHETLDRVPVMCQLSLGHYFLFSGYDPIDIWFDSETLAQAFERLRAEYDFDGYMLNLPGRPDNWREYVSSIEESDAGWVLSWANGFQTRVPRDDNPHTFLADGESLPRMDVKTVDIDNPATYRTPGYVWNTWHAPTLWDIPDDADLADPASYPDWFTSAVRHARRLTPSASVHAEVFSPFTHLLELFGYQEALMALLLEPETCRRLLEIFTGHVTAQIECLGPCQPDAILISSAFAGAGFISRDMYREFVMPYEKEIVRSVRKFEMPVYVHTCGAIGDRLDLMSETEVDGIDTLDPPPLGTVDLAEAKAQYGERFFLKGNLDAVNEMLMADDEMFEQAVIERLQIGKQGSGYILSSACSVAPHVKPERLKRMVDLAERYGRFED